MPDETNWTYVEDLKNPIEILFPSSNHILFVLRVEDSRDGVSFTPFDNLPLDPGHRPTIVARVSESFNARVRVAGSAHDVSSSIASSTDWLSSSNRLPSKPRSRALHTLAHDRPRST